MSLFVAAMVTPAIGQPARRGRPAVAPAFDVDQARRALVGADVAGATAAARDLGQAPGPLAASAHDALVDGLAMGLPAPVAIEALAAVVAHAAPSDVAVLALYAHSRSETVAVAAYRAMGRYPDAVTRAALLRGLGHRRAPVRMAAAESLGRLRAVVAVTALMRLLEVSDDAGVVGLAALADANLARSLGEQLGVLPEPALAKTLGAILLRPDFGPDDERLQLVRALAKFTALEAVTALSDYIEQTPAAPVRASRKEAETVVEAKLGGS